MLSRLYLKPYWNTNLEMTIWFACFAPNVYECRKSWNNICANGSCSFKFPHYLHKKNK